MQNLNTRRAAENNCCFAVWSVAKANRTLIAKSCHTKWAKLIAPCPTLVSFMWHFCPKTNESSRAKFPKTGTNRSVFRFQCRPQSDLNNLVLGASEYYAWARMHERRWVSVGLCIKMSVQLASRRLLPQGANKYQKQWRRNIFNVQLEMMTNISNKHEI